MKKILLFILGLAITGVGATAQNATKARQILDKTASIVGNKGGASANFTMKGGKTSTSGKISIKGNKFMATTPEASVWYDGKTQWTYMKQNDEVNVSNPSEAELQAINPYNFINIYKSGFKLSAKKVNNSYEVHLKATDKKRKIQEMYIIVDQNSYRPTHVKMQQNGKWSVLIISGLKATNLADGLFQFNAKDFPQAEIIDLR